jgi:hypothetical protein
MLTSCYSSVTVGRSCALKLKSNGSKAMGIAKSVQRRPTGWTVGVRILVGVPTLALGSTQPLIHCVSGRLLSRG